MEFNPRTMAQINLALQLTLTATVLIAAYLARFRFNFTAHCTVLRIGVAIQLVAVAGFMWQSMVGYVELGGLGPFFTAETLVHHSLGLGVIGIWVWANLVMLGVVKHRRRLLVPMRVSFFMWMASLALGLHMYVRIWVTG